MGDRKKLLWILLGLSLLMMVSARSTNEEEEDFEDAEEEEDDDDDGCDPACERKCHRLKCRAGTVRDSCGCCICAQIEGEYCTFKPRSKKRRGRRDVANLKRRLLSSFLSLTPPYTFAPTTSFTNPAFVEELDKASSSSFSSSSFSSSSSPTITDFYASTVAVDSFVIKNQNGKNKKQKQAPNVPIKRGGIYSRDSNRYLGSKKNYFDDAYGTCGDYLDCRPLFTNTLPDVGAEKEEEEKVEKKKDESFRVGKNPKLKPFYQEAKKKTTAKGKTSRFIEQWKKKKGLNFGSNWDRDGGGSEFNDDKNDGLQQSNNYATSDDNHKSLLQEDDTNFDDYFSSFFSSSSSPTNNIDNFLRSPVVGTCVCRYAVTVCASNGKTYKNICHLRSESGLGEGSNPEVHVIKEGPCDPPVEEQIPKIVSGPDYTVNYTGGSAAMSCEIRGYPIPFISWLKTNVDNETFELPSDDRSIMTLTQGGPEKHEITAWVQIMNLRKIHEGDYSCVAFNKHGKVKATGRLKVKKGKKKRHHHKKD